jgi:hypothetical protein
MSPLFAPRPTPAISGIASAENLRLSLEIYPENKLVRTEENGDAFQNPRRELRGRIRSLLSAGRVAHFQPSGPFSRTVKHVRDHSWEVTKPTPIQIGKPASRPSDEALAAIRQAVATTGVTSVYWFWISIAGDRPHLGLAVAPPDDEIVSRVGRAIEPIWKQHSPHNTLFDILRLGDPNIDRLIFENGEPLHP